MATKGYAAADTDIRALRPNWSTFTVSTAYSIGNSLENTSIASSMTAPSGWISAHIFRSFTSGNPRVIPRNIDNSSALVNVTDRFSGTNGAHGGGSTQSGTFTVVRFCYLLPSTNYWPNPGDGVRIDAAQLNGIGIEYTTFSLTGSKPISAHSSDTIALSSTNCPTGYDCYGIADWYSGNSWCVVYGALINPHGATGTISVYNINEKSSLTCSATMTGIAWRATYNTGKTYRTRVSGGTVLKPEHINNTKLTISDFIKKSGNITSLPRKKATTTVSGSAAANYTALPAVTRFNTGYKYLLPTKITSTTIEGVNVSVDYTSAPSVYCALWYFS